ncbi:MAG: DUF4252 domain-containing protein [Flavobacteriaceae bacterium]
MKKTFFFLCLLASFHLSAQNVFEQYGSSPAVSQLNVSPQMFQLLSKFKITTDDPDSQAFIEMIQQLKRFKVMSTQDATISTAMEEWFQREIEQTTLETVLNLTEKGVNVRFGAVYGEDESTVERLVMYVKGLQEFIDQQDNIQLNTTTKFDYVLLEIKGKIDLNQVATLTKLIDIPGGEYLDALKN